MHAIKKKAKDCAGYTHHIRLDSLSLCACEKPLGTVFTKGKQENKVKLKQQHDSKVNRFFCYVGGF